MTVEPLGDRIALIPETDDELELCAAIVEVIRAGGDIRVRGPISTRLIFDGEEKPEKSRKGKRAKLIAP